MRKTKTKLERKNTWKTKTKNKSKRKSHWCLAYAASCMRAMCPHSDRCMTWW